ncbi:phospholipase A2 [Streptomyces sp. Da 82-17]|uniref:phospholipase A2 n=1 Tax=Streptomyces sp. Da 82-17 TaxID=3377116 RepID=UPI0038D4433D
MRTLVRALAATLAASVLALAPAGNATADDTPERDTAAWNENTWNATTGGNAPAAGNTPVAGNPQLVRAADRIMALPVERFMEVERKPPFNWTTDGCSVPGGMAPYMKLFTPACTLHDFGYRNYGSRAGTLSLDPTPARRKAVDDRFLEEMRRTCDRKRPTPLRRAACYGAAHTYYDAVRIGGGRAFYA